jgi:hypothetical protein
VNDEERKEKRKRFEKAESDFIHFDPKLFELRWACQSRKHGITEQVAESPQDSRKPNACNGNLTIVLFHLMFMFVTIRLLSFDKPLASKRRTYDVCSL